MAKRNTQPPAAAGPQSAAPEPITDEQGNPLKFDAAIERLEAIIHGIESGEIGLEESLEGYEKGAKLIAHCQAILKRAETKIEELKIDHEPAETVDE